MNGSVFTAASSRSLALSLVTALAALVAGCGGGGDSAAPAATPVPPTITAQPGAQTVLTDATATFSVTATGPPLTYQWRKNGTAIAGANSACTTATTGATPTPCSGGTTLAAALTTGINSTNDGVTYHLADGVASTVGGVPVWVATAPRPQSATISTTTQYRIYFQLNGNVYTGALIQDGQVLGGSYWVSNPAGATVLDRLTFLPFQIRMNKAARDRIAADMAI